MKEKIADFGKGMFLVNTIGVVFDTKTRKILIGRKENDPHVPKLSWCFPGGGPKHNEDLENAVKREVKEETGLVVESLGPVFARILPEHKSILLIYYLCEVVGGKEKMSDEFKELKWISVDEIEKYFTTSIDSKLKEYLENLK
ncbi:MAG: NUDIX hydrolase [Candidatus Pacearchaeota archaeon]|jgi:ADP-ribose pyrophosphatase YjhB (NUDIX family)